MADDKSKNNLLTSDLDFEGFDDMLATPRVNSQPVPEPAYEPPKEFVRQPEKTENKATKVLPPVRKLPPAAKIADLPRVPLKKKIVVPKVEQDRFTLYAVLVVIIALIVISSGIYYARLSERNAAGLSYIVLPQIIVNVDGMVVRVQATIQVNDENKEWLVENKKVMSDVFAKKFPSINLEELRSSEGISQAQITLKNMLNEDLKSEKIEAVLLTDLVVQDQG
jgi:flagellar basal body-associated protein FliL